MAPTMVEGLPVCDLDRCCPLYDGKRCMVQGFRPESLCEPAVEAMGAMLDDDDAPPPADPALLAMANRMLAEHVERLEVAARLALQVDAEAAQDAGLADADGSCGCPGCEALRAALAAKTPGRG